MICTVSPQDRHKYEDLLSEAFFKCNEDVSGGVVVHDSPQAIYFVAVDEWFGVCGVAQLVPTIGDLQTWKLSEAHILLSEDIARRYSESVLAVFAGRFYHELFEALYHTAQQQGIHKIMMETSIEAIQDVWNVGWPLRELSDDYLYLNMSPETYEELLNNRKLFEQNVGAELKLAKRF
jgi:hypothetical protein